LVLYYREFSVKSVQLHPSTIPRDDHAHLIQGSR
jgi:hypothetical protein